MYDPVLWFRAHMETVRSNDNGVLQNSGGILPKSTRAISSSQRAQPSQVTRAILPERHWKGKGERGSPGLKLGVRRFRFEV
jgi:hypothetical protein